MGTLKSIAGKNGCGDGIVIATGRKGCQIPFGSVKHLIRLKKGTVIPYSTEFNSDYIISLIQSGTATVLMDITGFERLSGDDGFSTTSDTTERINLKGLPKYKATFQEGHEFYRQLSKLTGFKNSDWLIIDDSGSIKIARKSNDDFSGFKAGQVVAEQVMEKVQGGDGESKSITIQFLDRDEWDNNYDVVEQSQHQIDWSDIDGVNAATIEFNSIIEETSENFIITAKLNSDKNTLVEGALLSDFLIEINGLTAAVTISEENGEYTITPPDVLSSGDIISASFNGIINIENTLFSSEKTSNSVV